MTRLTSRRPNTRLNAALIVVACAVLGAGAVAIGVQALAFLAQAMDAAWLRDVALNTGPLAVAGGAAAGGAAAGGGGTGDPWVPFKTKVYDPSTGTMRDPSLYERLVWEVGRRMEGLPTDEERYHQIMSDDHLRSQYRNESRTREDPPAEPTMTDGDPLAEPPDQAGGFGSVQQVQPPSTSGNATQDPGGNGSDLGHPGSLSDGSPIDPIT